MDSQPGMVHEKKSMNYSSVPIRITLYDFYISFISI